MSDEPRPMDFASHIRKSVGGTVVRAEPGVGSMLTIDVEQVGRANQLQRIWVYLADWALLREETECLAADMADETYADARPEIFDMVGKMILRVDLLGESEVHLSFSGQLRLEIWPNPEAYGADQKLILLFANGHHISTLTG